MKTTEQMPKYIFKHLLKPCLDSNRNIEQRTPQGEFQFSSGTKDVFFPTLAWREQIDGELQRQMYSHIFEENYGLAKTCKVSFGGTLYFREVSPNIFLLFPSLADIIFSFPF